MSFDHCPIYVAQNPDILRGVSSPCNHQSRYAVRVTLRGLLIPSISLPYQPSASVPSSGYAGMPQV